MKEPVMSSRRNQPENNPCGRFRCTPVERPATTFFSGRRTIGFTTALPAGVLARLLARKNRLVRLKTNGLTGLRLVQLPTDRRIYPLKFRS